MTALRRSDYAVAIVGAGVIGLYTAYHLARAGVGPILVVDRGFLSSGASGRNGGGVRQQWQTRATVRLARESVEAYRHFGREFGYNIWFRQGGYLFLAESDAEIASLERVGQAVRAEGLPVRRLVPEQIHDLVPALNVTGVRGAAFLHSDGTAYPFPVLWGLYEAAREAGVELSYGTNVTEIGRAAGRVAGLTTSRGPLSASIVVDAAGGWSGDVARMAGLPVPNVASRHEILATEPLKPFLDPMVIRLRDGLYFSQTMRGEIVGGLGVHHPPGTRSGMPSTMEFLTRMARAITGLLPSTASLGILRAWSGFYDETPDGLPMLGEDPRLPGFFHANGLGGHGFMLAPAVSRRVARLVMGEPIESAAEFSVARFLGATLPAPAERLTFG
jgi:sarcosine oxidase, subunit beta